MVDSRKLLFGPYRTPRFKYGAKVLCEARGDVRIVKLSAGPVPWPVGSTGARGTPSIVLYADLARAVRRETNRAVAHHWGVTGQTVTKWRKALGVTRTEGDTRWRIAFGKSPAMRKAVKAMAAKLQCPERAAKIAAAKRGVSRSQATIAKMRKAATGRRHTAESRAKMSSQRKGTRPPAAGIPWSDAENKLLRTLPVRKVAQRTGRTVPAVYMQRARLGINDGRTTRHKRQP